LISREAKRLIDAKRQGQLLWQKQQDLFREMGRASAEICYDRNMMLSLVSVHGEFLRFSSPELRNDTEVVYIAAQTDQFILEKASEDLRRNRDFMMRVMKVDGRSLRHAGGRHIREDKELVLAALSNSARALEYAGDNLKSDYDVVSKALHRQKEEGEKFNVIRFAGPEIRSNKDMILLAYRLSASEYVARESYQKASEAIQQEFPWKDFLAAAESSLAVKGEEAPAVTVRVQPFHNPNNHNHPTSFYCEAKLMSGTTFTFDVPDTPTLVVGRSSRPVPTAEDMAKVLVTKLYPGRRPEQVCDSHRVYIVLVRNEQYMQVTPWHHSQPLTNLLP